MNASVEETGMSDFVQVLVTIDSEEKARELQRLLVERRAAACVQLMGPICSSYWWEGQIEDAKEWICLAKTEAAQYDRLESLVKEHHPYSVPEILAVPILTGNRGYLDWVKAETIAGQQP
jgi:periplasmic divalent cation tolerance protein